MISKVRCVTLFASSILRIPTVLAMLYSVHGGDAQMISKDFGG